MLSQFFHKFSFVIIILLFCHKAYALIVELRPAEVIPGDVYLIKVSSVEAPVGEFNGKEIRFFKTGDKKFIALVPIDIDTPSGDYKITIRNSEGIKYLDLRVNPHDFPTERLTLPEEKVTLRPEDEKRVEEEYLLLEGLFAKTTERMWGDTFIQPVDTKPSTEFGIRRIINNKKTSIHKGVDYRGRKGSPVKAMNSGRVVLTRELFYGGKTAIIDHGMGIFSVYMHLSGFNVLEGEDVSAGEVIGFIGDTGRANGPHLHISIRLNGISINPLSLLRLGRI